LAHLVAHEQKQTEPRGKTVKIHHPLEL